MKNQTIKLKEINLTIGRKELSLNLEECKELHQVLSDLLGAKTVIQHQYGYYPYTLSGTDRAINTAEGNGPAITTTDSTFSSTVFDINGTEALTENQHVNA